MSDFEVRGAEDFYRLSKALKHAGRTELRKELHKGLRDGAKPLIPKTRQAALARLPQRGGLARRMAKAPQRVVVKTGKDPRIQLAMPGKQPGYNEGLIRRPVFARKVREQSVNSKRKDGTVAKYRDRGGREARWVTQRIDGEWFDGTIVRNARSVLPALEQALNHVADKVVSEAKG